VQISEFFEFYTSSELSDGSAYSDFIDAGHVLSFQALSSGTDWFNGMNFIKTISQDEDEGEIDPINFIDYEYEGNELWSVAKLLSSHPETNLEVDPTRGNRITAAPFAVRRVGIEEEMSLQIGHFNIAGVVFESFDEPSGDLVLRILSEGGNIPLIADLDMIGLPVVVSVESEALSSQAGPGGLFYNITSDITEYEGTVIDKSIFSISVNIGASSGIPDTDLHNAIAVSLGGQVIKILPLGYVISGVDQYNSLPSAEGIISWPYYDNDLNMTSGVQGITPRLKLSLPSVGDTFKFMIIIERDSGSLISSNGFRILPNLIQE
jgi:hypothetical protein